MFSLIYLPTHPFSYFFFHRILLSMYSHLCVKICVHKMNETKLKNSRKLYPGRKANAVHTH